MKILFLLFLASLLFSKSSILPESTVAVVNGIAITEDELDREVRQLIPSTYIHTNVNTEKINLLKKKALDELVDKTLLYSYALKNNINVSSEEIQGVISSLMNRYESKELFNKALKESNFTMDTLIISVKKEEILKKLYKKKIEKTLNDEELKSYYEKNAHKFLEPEKIRVSLIYIKNDPKDPQGKEKALKKIKEAEELLAKGENFEYVAQTYSNDPSRVMGGDMGYLHRGILHSAVEETAFSMEVNKVSNVIVNDTGYYIVKTMDKKQQNQLSFETVKNRLEKELKKKEEDKRKEELLKSLSFNAVIVK